jgi:hypothetical protein
MSTPAHVEWSGARQEHNRFFAGKTQKSQKDIENAPIDSDTGLQ